MKPFDYCQLFKAIEADPLAPLVLTVGQYYGAADHIRDCTSCREIADRVANSAPDDHNHGIEVSQN